ncbi:MAG: DUF3592 domain-containing protein [Chloroflexota bacterium]
MITCTHCGTSHKTHQATCPNCGAVLPPFENSIVGSSPKTALTAPPPIPREAPPQYIQRTMLTEGWAIVGLVFFILGAVFTLVGLGLTLAIVTAFIGLPFCGLGLLFWIGSIPVLMVRYQQVKLMRHIFKVGQSTQGEIVAIQQNRAVRINRQYPWMIKYKFRAIGQEYQGEMTTLNPTAAHYKLGQPVYILYLEDDPRQNILYLPENVS